MVAVLSRIFGIARLDVIMDIVQDTFEAALTQWRFSGVPENPSGWLMLVAKNKALNTFKRESKTQTFAPEDYLAHFDESIEDRFDEWISMDAIGDSQLQLLLLCCYPELSTKNQIIITLHILCGFGVPEIANALVMQEEAVKKALSRSKAMLRSQGQATRSSPSVEQVGTVQTILYLMFNEGYKTTRSAQAINNDLCYEAMRLTKLLVNHPSPAQECSQALLALFFFTVSRFPERVGADHEWITLKEQDRSKWNRLLITEGYYYLNKATQTTTLSRFHIEAIIASLHCAAPSFAETDWSRIAYLYKQLEQIEPSPMVKLNRIIAESYVDPTNSINDLELLVDHTHLYWVILAKADVYRRSGKTRFALEHYQQAMQLAQSPMDQEFIRKQVQSCLEHIDALS